MNKSSFVKNKKLEVVTSLTPSIYRDFIEAPIFFYYLEAMQPSEHPNIISSNSFPRR